MLRVLILHHIKKLPGMDLKMFISDVLIDTIEINAVQFSKPGYIEFLKIELQEKNEDIIDLSNEEPQFFIDAVPSSMNFNYRSLQ